MALSRLRVRLAAWFAVAFLVALGILDITLYWYLREQASRRLTHELTVIATDVTAAVRRESADDSGAAAIARAAVEALAEWPDSPEGVAIYAGDGTRLGVHGPALLTVAAPLRAGDLVSQDVKLAGGGSARGIWRQDLVEQPITILVLGSTERLTQDNEALAWWLAISSPLAAVLSLAGGYLLSRRALIPIGDLQRAVTAVAPGDLTRRLPVREPADEIGRLAAQFNAMLDRLEQSQALTQAFLRRAAHQIRTPLTLVLGEAELSLDRERDAESYRAALQRVQRAAGQMRRRVNDLFLLAQAEAGERITLDAMVDLDGLALEVADLMRERAQGLGHRLELSRVEPVAVRGSEPLLQEAFLELMENACRHSAPGAIVSASVFTDAAFALLAVSSEGDALDTRPAPAVDESRGFGLPIVTWIAEQHGGRLLQSRTGTRNTFALMLPLGAT